MLLNLQGLMTVCGEPFIVLAPTARYRSELVGAMLHREQCAFIPLASCLAPEDAGFRVTNSVRPILDRFAAGCVPLGRSKVRSEEEPARKPDSGQRGRLRCESGFLDLWLGGEFYDLRERNKARLCIEYLFEKGAFDKTSARHFEKEIDPYVRKHSKLEALPDYAEKRIHHYFNPSTGRIGRLGRELVQSAGRGSGRYFLNVH
jgi:hypothetical protein